MTADTEPKVEEMVQMPDGKGGYIAISAERIEGSKADVSKQQVVFDAEALKAHEARVGNAAEAFNGFHKAYATDHTLTEEELVKGIYLELLNLKEFYPKELGGEERFDELCSQTHRWFKEQIG